VILYNKISTLEELPMISNSKILITGAGGLFGTALCKKLIDTNEVWGLARFRDHQKAIELDDMGVKLIRRDVTKESIDDIPDDFDYVFHMLAILYDADLDHQDTYEANIYFTGFMMEHCRKANGIILASSGGVYHPSVQYEKEDTTLGPVGAYCTSKYAMETLGTYLSRKHRIPAAIIRYFWPYGREQGRVTRMMKSIMAHEPISVSSGQEALYQPIHIDDVVRLTLAAVPNCDTPPPVFNMAGPETVSWRDLAERIGYAVSVPPVFDELDENRLSHLADLTKMKAILGQPEINLNEGIARVKEELGF
jgi:nucleoside-diphosphate-sugar epimerase